MPTTLNLCFNKIKLPLTSSSSSSSSSLSLTPDDHSRPFPSSTSTATTTSSHSPLLFKSYNSLYDNTFDSNSNYNSSSEPEPDPDPNSDSEPDFATVFASQRFFFTSPGSSNSIVESASSSIATTTSESSNRDGAAAAAASFDPPTTTSTVKDSVAVPTISPDPYHDFRRSMQEMVEARGLDDVKANWDYLHELLLCYLALNPKSTHKLIIGAFADLLVTLMAADGGASARAEADHGGVTEITGGRCM